ncbi:hypothetical protein GUJ93_ZPchr0006g45929 [Zizania palustris]|uniref:Uncharacterized protein n=1 Tax=Zizania palustris TaxID=103762 RepID=A0A8J5SFU9_ZIZPA|nr:hypothetical protein GUJ93_ZPchr0006g45929 [Zizania palustris]
MIDEERWARLLPELLVEVLRRVEATDGERWPASEGLRFVLLSGQTLSKVHDKNLVILFAGSKDEMFFDSRAWLDSDCEDDFYSVNGLILRIKILMGGKCEAVDNNYYASRGRVRR